MPTLFLSHGAPPLVDDPTWVAQLRELAATLPRPKAILMASAHWESAPLMLGATETVPLVYDFGGFPQHYYQVEYRAPGAPVLADQVAALMPDGEPVARTDRGLDHGAYVPLTVMYPEADIPVLQMSLPTCEPDRLLDLGARLAPLRDEGVLIVGSGFTTHGLPFLRDWRTDAVAPGWSREFDAWTAETLARGAVDELADFRAVAPGMPYAHPTIEHFAPMFLTLGASGTPDQAPDQPIDGFWMGLAKRSFVTA
ncbi:class III extradiol ring-cleavage dioxygenase [Actinoplanes oblitus]|uniref:Class III extradiol ring-cleavage dioxygenase n=1 Tax=Actinoplanes oblitus TaxID=3040509 RepID=A0ABY8WSB6_9ACTN|nr:class III extradiol ring-cleavage dioxygenase [Actinoplanes oblitus]WIN00790.1 class III extradiol ring-cleavage dioxygenase [Actinoplanes oblitus]